MVLNCVTVGHGQSLSYDPFIVSVMVIPRGKKARLCVVSNRVVLRCAEATPLATKRLRVHSTQNLAETLSNTSNALIWVPCWHPAPHIVLHLLALHVDEIFLAASASIPAQVLATKHDLVIFNTVTLLRHHVIQILHLSL